MHHNINTKKELYGHKNHGEYSSQKLNYYTTAVAASIASVMIVMKFWAWLATNAVSLQASLLDSTVDCISSICATFAIRLSQRPAHAPYAFGFGKLEPLVSLGQSLLVMGSAFFLGTESIHRLFKPEPIENTDIGLAVIIISTMLTFILVHVQRYAIHRTHSMIVYADSLHYQVDLLANFGIILSLLFNYWFNFSMIDSIFGLSVALYIVASAVKIIWHAACELLDKSIPDEKLALIRQLIEAQPGILGIVWIKTRTAGTFVFLTAGVRVETPVVAEAISTLQQVKVVLKKRFPNIDALLSIESEETAATFCVNCPDQRGN
ncbi:MAG: cation diffusion facilitator family transporter [Holosporales bacterium]|jgi:ferrous-iron efflux pump FieF|nr:cation diffusion facilitator family transporter [Holosporales bacterium]